MLFISKGHVALDRNLGLGYNNLLLRLIPGDLLSACADGQFQTLPDLFRQSGCTVKLLTLRMYAKQGGNLYHFNDGLGYDMAGDVNMQPHHMRGRHANPKQGKDDMDQANAAIIREAEVAYVLIKEIGSLP